MAQVRMLTWNVQVFGPKKYSNPANGVALVNFIGAVAKTVNANLVVIVETMSSVVDQVAFNLCEGLGLTVGGNWRNQTLITRPNGDRESYAIFWRTDAGFEPAMNGQEIVSGLPDVPFPNNFSDKNGRRAGYLTFVTSGNVPFTTVAYHAPPNARAIPGLAALAKIPELYSVQGNRIDARLIGGDFNLDIQVQQEFSWMTDPVPANPPPSQPGQGAGCTPATRADTELYTFAQASAASRWGANLDNWPMNSAAYARTMAIDNIFWASPAGNGQGTVVDVIGAITNLDSDIGQAARRFRADAGIDFGLGFPNADKIPAPLARSLDRTPCAFILYACAISDHLPVFLSLTI